MNSGHSTPNQFALPHYSHSEPWAHDVICCDTDHNASTSRPSTPITRFTSHHRSQPSTSTINSFDVPVNAQTSTCCDETHCADVDGLECCTDPACQQGAICEDDTCRFPHNPDAAPGDPDSAESMRELERWACSKEGCHAIQQYLECCTQDDCALPVCTDPHPAPVVCNHDPNSTPSQPDQFDLDGFMPTNSRPAFQSHTHQHQQQNIFDPSLLPPAPWPQPISSSDTSACGNASFAGNNQQTVVPNVCHWQNCHQVFGTTPELLAHIAADHLNAPAVAPASMPLPTGNGNGNGDQSINTNMQSLLDTSSLNTQPFDLSNLQLGNNGLDPLMSCLWDDCFPSNPVPTNFPANPDLTGNVFNNASQNVSTAQNFNQQLVDPSQTAMLNSARLAHTTDQQMHGHGHAHGHVHGSSGGHTHSHPTGEPFSPQTMLRHVLEEHLGLNPGDLSWNGGSLMPPPVPSSTPILPSVSSTATTPVITPIHPVKPHHHHIPILPTPSPSTYTSSPPPHPKGLFCMWPGCHAHCQFPDTASLMAHLSDEHVGKCKNTYTCLWDTCGHTGGREFKSRQKVLRHLQSHIGHKPYVCEVCDQAFSEAAPLAAHKRRHAQEKPFKCDHPGCDKTFAISSSLTIHMRTHNGEKPFVCPHCDKGFVEASNLTKHIRTHTGERPFGCSFPGCEKRFPRPDQLKRHMAVHDADRPARGKRRNGSIVDLAALA